MQQNWATQHSLKKITTKPQTYNELLKTTRGGVLINIKSMADSDAPAYFVLLGLQVTQTLHEWSGVKYEEKKNIIVKVSRPVYPTISEKPKANLHNLAPRPFFNTLKQD